MVNAFAFAKTSAGASPEIVESVRAFPFVSEAHVVAGEFDIVLEIEADDVYDILTMVTAEVQSLDGVSDTKTYITLED